MRRSIIVEAREGGSDEIDESKEDESSTKMMQRPKTTASILNRGGRKYRHMFYSGTWPRVHSELFMGTIDRLAPRDRNMVMFQDVRKQQPETFIFHPEWV